MKNVSNILASDMLLNEIRSLFSVGIENIDRYFLERMGKNSDEFKEYMKDRCPSLTSSIYAAIETAKALIDERASISNPEENTHEFMMRLSDEISEVDRRLKYEAEFEKFEARLFGEIRKTFNGDKSEKSEKSNLIQGPWGDGGNAA